MPRDQRALFRTQPGDETCPDEPVEAALLPCSQRKPGGSTFFCSFEAAHACVNTRMLWTALSANNSRARPEEFHQDDTQEQATKHCKAEVLAFSGARRSVREAIRPQQASLQSMRWRCCEIAGADGHFCSRQYAAGLLIRDRSSLAAVRPTSAVRADLHSQWQAKL